MDKTIRESLLYRTVEKEKYGILGKLFLVCLIYRI